MKARSFRFRLRFVLAITVTLTLLILTGILVGIFGGKDEPEVESVTVMSIEDKVASILAGELEMSTEVSKELG